MSSKIFKEMKCKKPARDWHEGLQIGNGKIGALIMGDPLDETVIINHEELFLPLPINEGLEIPDMTDCLQEIRNMLREGHYEEASRFFYNKMVERGFPKELVWTNPFHPAFDLKINLDAQGDIKDYSRSLNFESGEARVEWIDERGKFIRRAFASRTDDAVIMSVGSPSGGKLCCSLKITERPGKRYVESVDIKTADDYITYHSAYQANKKGYEGAARVICKGGTAKASGQEIIIKDADEVVIMIKVVPLEDAGISAMNSIKTDLDSIPADYDVLLQRHASKHGEMFNRVRLDLCEGRNLDLTNEELLDVARREGATPELIEKLHDFARYALIASSGKLPPNLQGIWNGSWNPPWSSDYTLDENVQMMMWPVLPGNLPECLESYFNLIESYLDDWKINAKKLYGCRGILSSPRASSRGLLTHFSIRYPLQFWTAGAGWLAQPFFDYWLFTGDREFLRKRALPYMKEIALFYEDFLTEDENGKYFFNPSYSPENTPSNSNSQACVNATMDIAVAKELLSNLVSACEELDIEHENVLKWKAMIKKLPDYMINRDGALKEWTYEGLEDNYHHRHSSHLYPVFPGFEITPEEQPELFKACCKAAELRLTDGIEAISGWGLAHLACISARLKKSDLLYLAMTRIMQKFTASNLFTYHNEGNCFQFDANLGFMSAVLEMIVYSRPGWLELLPALPEKLKKGSISGVLCRGRITVEYLEWNMNDKSIKSVIKSDVDQEITLKVPYTAVSIRINGADSTITEIDSGKGGWKLRLPSHQSVRIEISSL